MFIIISEKKKIKSILFTVRILHVYMVWGEIEYSFLAPTTDATQSARVFL